jgi:multicomponent Na+:H+ antiporter subunit E
MTFPVKRSLLLTVVLFGVWVLWSGHFTPLLLGFGAGSCVGVVLLCRRMRIIDEEGVPVQLGLRPFVQYLPWLIKEIVLANIDVARRILDPRLPIRPSVLRVKASQKDELGRVVYANSITLTPGTVSMGLEGDEILVHALSAEAAQFEASGEMDRRVSRLEAGR